MTLVGTAPIRRSRDGLATTLRLSVDTNILVYAYDREAGTRHEQAVELMTRVGVADCILALQSLAEFVYVTTRKGKLSLANATTRVRELGSSFPICVATMRALEAAMAARERHQLPFWDAMLWATVQQAGCEMLLTEDFQDGRRLGSVTFVNPFRPKNTELVNRALAPAGI